MTWYLTHSHTRYALMWHASCIRTHSLTWHDLFVLTHTLELRASAQRLARDSFTGVILSSVTWLIHAITLYDTPYDKVWSVTHSNVWYSWVRHDSFMWKHTLGHTTLWLDKIRESFTCVMLFTVTWLMYTNMHVIACETYDMKRDSFACVNESWDSCIRIYTWHEAWLIYMCQCVLRLMYTNIHVMTWVWQQLMPWSVTYLHVWYSLVRHVSSRENTP